MLASGKELVYTYDDHVNTKKSLPKWNEFNCMCRQCEGAVPVQPAGGYTSIPPLSLLILRYAILGPIIGSLGFRV